MTSGNACLRLPLFLASALAIGGCDSDDDGTTTDTSTGTSDTSTSDTSTSDTSTTSGGDTLVIAEVAVGVSNPDSDPNPGAVCHARVLIGLYGDDTCTAGEEMMLIEMDLAHDCYGWSRESERGTVVNSSTRFQCYRDRLCYTQHTETLDCDNGTPTDKEVRTDSCTVEPQGGLWTRIITGTEGCPPIPSGTSCTLSAGHGGTPGMEAAATCE